MRGRRRIGGFRLFGSCKVEEAAHRVFLKIIITNSKI